MHQSLINAKSFTQYLKVLFITGGKYNVIEYFTYLYELFSKKMFHLKPILPGSIN